MWEALKNVALLVSKGGILFISIYNDQGVCSNRWRSVKHFYCSGRIGRILVLAILIPYFVFRGLISDIIRLKNPFKRYNEYKKSRGMSMFHDWIDWLGGYPFEVAKPEKIFDFYKKENFCLIKLKTCGGGLGCNEYVFIKE